MHKGKYIEDWFGAAALKEAWQKLFSKGNFQLVFTEKVPIKVIFVLKVLIPEALFVVIDLEMDSARLNQ